MITRVPVAPETITVLGYRVKADDPRWLGLNLAKAEPRMQASLMLAIAGDEAPEDIHLSVPWCHPDDRANGMDDDACRYRVRPRMKSGKRWKGRKVVSVAFERWNGKWFIAIGYKGRQNLGTDVQATTFDPPCASGSATSEVGRND